jgi:hypothetical protein
LRIDTAFHSAKPEKGTVNKRTMREEKAIARYQDNLQREMDETRVFIQLVIHNISYIAKKKLSY